ncbi:hypothetical protein [Thermus scotoductus]|nr:hypothetical protein [Thermus scotoductus]
MEAGWTRTMDTATPYPALGLFREGEGLESPSVGEGKARGLRPPA